MLADIGPLIEGVVTGGAKGLSREIMESLPALKIIAISGIGTDAVDWRMPQSTVSMSPLHPAC